MRRWTEMIKQILNNTLYVQKRDDDIYMVIPERQGILPRVAFGVTRNLSGRSSRFLEYYERGQVDWHF